MKLHYPLQGALRQRKEGRSIDRPVVPLLGTEEKRDCLGFNQFIWKIFSSSSSSILAHWSSPSYRVPFTHLKIILPFLPTSNSDKTFPLFGISKDIKPLNQICLSPFFCLVLIRISSPFPPSPCHPFVIYLEIIGIVSPCISKGFGSVKLLEGQI